MMTSKSLTTEIEQLRRTHTQKRLNLSPILSSASSSSLSTSIAPLRPLHQFELGLPDRDILFDVLKLTFSFLDRDQSGYSGPERARVEAFLRLFVPLLLGVPHAEMEANLAHSNEVPEEVEGDHEDEAEAEANHEAEVEENESEAEGGHHVNGVESDVESSNGTEVSEAGARSPSGKSNGNGVNKKGGAADLRKRLLVHAATTAGRELPSGASSVASGSRDVSPEEAGTSQGCDLSFVQLDEIIGAKKAGELEGAEERRFNFFTNSTFYCLVRIIHVRSPVS
jgi:paired amphipathic helix protein Sin3a